MWKTRAGSDVNQAGWHTPEITALGGKGRRILSQTKQKMRLDLQCGGLNENLPRRFQCLNT